MFAEMPGPLVIELANFARPFRCALAALLALVLCSGCNSLFGLDRIVKYKRGRVAQRRAGQDELASLLRRRLPRLDPPLRLNAGLRRLLQKPPRELRGRTLKAREDELDAVFCAYLAAHLWAWGRSRQRLLGSAGDGVMVLPAVRTDV